LKVIEVQLLSIAVLAVIINDESNNTSRNVSYARKNNLHFS